MYQLIYKHETEVETSFKKKIYQNKNAFILAISAWKTQCIVHSAYLMSITKNLYE